MSYQQYMNMGFGGPHSGNPYMMSYQGGLPGQMMQPAQNQYIPNHKPPSMAQQLPNQQMALNWQSPGVSTAASATVATPPTAVVSGNKRKLVNDPNRPKRPTSAYFYFVQLEREEAAKRGEKITRVAEWTKAISGKWRELTLKEKETFQQMAASDKQRYFTQMAVYTGKDLNRPKRPQSAYFLWLADFRARVKDQFTENKDILRAAGEEWRKISMMAKAPYEQKAEEERRKYEQAMKEYNVSGGAKKPRVDDVITQQTPIVCQPIPATQPTYQQQPVTAVQHAQPTSASNDDEDDDGSDDESSAGDESD